MTTVYTTQEMHVWKFDVTFSHQHWLLNKSTSWFVKALFEDFNDIYYL